MSTSYLKKKNGLGSLKLKLYYTVSAPYLGSFQFNKLIFGKSTILVMNYFREKTTPLWMGVGLPQKENIVPLWVLPQDWWGQEVDKEAWACDCLWAWGTGDLYAGMRDLFRAFPLWGGKLIPGTETGLSLGKEGWTIENAYGGLWSVTSENLYIQEQLWSSLSVFPFPFFFKSWSHQWNHANITVDLPIGRNSVRVWNGTWG